jgi:hypothetical protein
MNNGLQAVIGIATAITGLAILAVLVSKNASTVQVIQAAANAYTSAIKEAVSPVTSAG